MGPGHRRLHDAALQRPGGVGAGETKGLDLPFIIVSGHITDDTAVAAMKAGAHDYVMKDNLARLGQAVQRELREAEVRRERRRTEEKLKVEHALREAIENSVPSGIAAVDLDGRQTYVNPAFCGMVGWSEAELVGAKPPFVYWPPEEVEAITDGLKPGHPGQRACRAASNCDSAGAPASAFTCCCRSRPSKTASAMSPAGSVRPPISPNASAPKIRLAAEHAITRILANAQSLEEAAPGILQVLLDSLEVDVGQLWTR